MNLASNYLELMFSVLFADGVVHEEEIKLFRRMLSHVGLAHDLQRRYLDILENRKPLDLDVVLARIAAETDHATLLWFLRDGYLMAAADCRISREEVKLVDAMLAGCGIPRERTGLLRRWGRQQVRQIQKGAALLVGA